MLVHEATHAQGALTNQVAVLPLYCTCTGAVESAATSLHHTTLNCLPNMGGMHMGGMPMEVLHWWGSIEVTYCPIWT